MSRIAIIGSGVFGVWTALLARRLGYETTLIDSRAPGNEQGSSGGESRIIRLAYGGDELYTRFAAQSLTAWKDFFREQNCPECFQNTGALWIAKKGDSRVAAVRSVFDKLGIHYEFFEGEKLNNRFPQFAFAEDCAGVLEPESGALLAAKSVQAVFAACLREGVRFINEVVLPPNEEVTAIETASGKRIEADAFVFAAGSWLPRLFPDLLGDRIFPTRQELFFFEAPQEYEIPVWIDQSGSKIAYGFPEIDNAGAKIAFHELGPAFDPEYGDRTVTREQIEQAASFLGERFPAMRGARLLSTRVCPYENTSSGDFLIDQHPQRRNVWLVGGGSGHGFKHGPAIAAYLLRAMTDQVETEPRFLLSSKQGFLNREVV